MELQVFKGDSDAAGHSQNSSNNQQLHPDGQHAQRLLMSHGEISQVEIDLFHLSFVCNLFVLVLLSNAVCTTVSALLLGFSECLSSFPQTPFHLYLHRHSHCVGGLCASVN